MHMVCSTQYPPPIVDAGQETVDVHLTVDDMVMHHIYNLRQSTSGLVMWHSVW